MLRTGAIWKLLNFPFEAQINQDMAARLAVANPTPDQILSVLQEFFVFMYTILKIHILKYRLKLCNFSIFICGLDTALFSHTGHPKTLPKLVTPHKSSPALAAPQHLPCRRFASTESPWSPAPRLHQVLLPPSCSQLQPSPLRDPARQRVLLCSHLGSTQKNTLNPSPLAHSDLLVFQPKSGGWSLNLTPRSLSCFAKPAWNAHWTPQRNSLFTGHVNESACLGGSKCAKLQTFCTS